MAGKSSGRTRSCGLGATFTRLPDAILWARIGQDVTGGSWIVRRTPTGWVALSPTEQRQERELVTTR